MADMSVSKPTPLPPPDDGKNRLAGKREPRKRPPAKPAAKTGSAPSAPGASGAAPDPEHKLDLLV